MRAAQKVAVITPGFSTHNLMMSQRYVFLACTCPPPAAQMVCNTTYVAVVICTCTIPSNYAVTPAGDYLVTLLDGGGALPGAVDQHWALGQVWPVARHGLWHQPTMASVAPEPRPGGFAPELFSGKSVIYCLALWVCVSAASMPEHVAY